MKDNEETKKEDGTCNTKEEETKEKEEDTKEKEDATGGGRDKGENDGVIFSSFYVKYIEPLKGGGDEERGGDEGREGG